MAFTKGSANQLWLYPNRSWWKRMRNTPSLTSAVIESACKRRSIIHALCERTGKTHTISGFVGGESKFCIGNRVLKVIFANVIIIVDVTLQGRDKAVNVSTRVRCLSACKPCKGRKPFRVAYALTQKESNPLESLPRFVRTPKLH